MVCLSRQYRFDLFKGCLPQILLSPFLNTLSQVFPKILKNSHENLYSIKDKFGNLSAAKFIFSELPNEMLI